MSEHFWKVTHCRASKQEINQRVWINENLSSPSQETLQNTYTKRTNRLPRLLASSSTTHNSDDRCLYYQLKSKPKWLFNITTSTFSNFCFIHFNNTIFEEKIEQNGEMSYLDQNSSIAPEFRLHSSNVRQHWTTIWLEEQRLLSTEIGFECNTLRRFDQLVSLKLK
jgi:hypothetical protein